MVPNELDVAGNQKFGYYYLQAPPNFFKNALG